MAVAAAERYRKIDIAYIERRYETGCDYPKIILKTGEKDYELYFYLLRTAKIDSGTILRKLNESRKATIWIGENDNGKVFGIVSPTLVIEPSVGAEWQRSNNLEKRWMAFIFIAGGAILVFCARRRK